MNIAARVATAIVALLHLYFLVLEMFLWTRPIGLRIFRLKPEFAKATARLAMNQGLYNGFLAAGLFWGAAIESPPIALFFLGCVVVAGIFGAFTVNRRIFFIQAVPALVAMALVMMR